MSSVEWSGVGDAGAGCGREQIEAIWKSTGKIKHEIRKSDE